MGEGSVFYIEVAIIPELVRWLSENYPAIPYTTVESGRDLLIVYECSVDGERYRGEVFGADEDELAMTEEEWQKKRSKYIESISKRGKIDEENIFTMPGMIKNELCNFIAATAAGITIKKEGSAFTTFHRIRLQCGGGSLLWTVVILLSFMALGSPIVGAREPDVAPAPRIEESNSIETHKHIDCGTIAANITTLLLRNPHYPDPIYTKSICETVIERADPLISKLDIKFNKLELYRPTIDGECLHDRFAVYTDLNAIVTPVLCGNQTGKIISIPFVSKQSSLIVSITTSDLDHDRAWAIEISQRE